MIVICLQACMLQVKQEVVTLTVSLLIRTTAIQCRFQIMENCENADKNLIF